MKFRFSAWTTIPGFAFAIVALFTEAVVRLWHIDLPIVFPFILALFRPLAWIEHFFWPHPTIFYTPYSYVIDGPPGWLRWVWLMSVSYLIGAVVGKLAQIAVAPLRRRRHHSLGPDPPKLTPEL